MDLRRWCEFWIINAFLLLCIRGIGLSGYECSPGLNFPGYTVPHGDIVIKYGDPLDITCVVKNTSYSGSSEPSRLLSFRRNTETIPAEMIEVINSTAIKLHINKPPKVSSDNYACVLDNKTTVCMNFVSVGVAPQKVTDFDCIGYNFVNLVCSWTPPENYIKTIYNLTFHVSYRSSRMPLQCPEIKYPSSDNSSSDRKMSCFWNISTTPHYRQVHDIFNFTLQMKNSFGTNQIVKTFKHFAHVLSGPAENLTVISSTPSSLYLHWEVPVQMQTFPPGVHHRILYNCHFEGEEYHLGALITTEPTAKEKYFNLTNLKYAFDLCDIVVSLRSAKALPNDNKMWSENKTITHRTQSKVPDRPPETTVGSFEVSTAGTLIETKDAFIYWKQIEENEKNGPHFKYRILVENNESLRPVELTDTYAKFANLSILQSHKFNIWSENENGTSIYKSVVHMPSRTDQVKEPSVFNKVEFGNGIFELSWEPPALKPWEHITNYTIFWCNNDRDRPHQCKGQLDWKIVPNDTVTTVKVDASKNYQFAVSANTHNSSSGMLWASCVIIHNQNMGKMKNVWVNTFGSTFIEIGWKLECSDRIGSVKGFIIYYCPLKSGFNRECKGPQRNQTFTGGTSLVRGNITSLIPNTEYVLTVAAIIKHGTFSQQSDPLFNRTSEDAPSTPPQNIIPLGATNSSISLQWDPPVLMNGVLQRYRIHYNNEYVDVNNTNFTLTGLEGYTNYTISMEACTVKCSTRSRPILISTKMGYPSQILKPTVDRRNDTTILIVWDRPSQPRGRNDYFTVSFKQKLERENRTLEYNVTNRRYVIENCGDGGKYNTFYVSVRAVNIIDGKQWAGPWSKELENYCDTPVNYIMFILAVVVIVFFVAMAFLFNRLYHHCKLMRDVEVKLPPGLAPVVAEHTLVPWSTDLRPEKPDVFAPPDEELLLIKMSDGRHFSGDSSGCSSGHESVTSSLESGTHISSSSDSGTEQTGGNYCVLGTDPKIDSSYVCDVSTESSPYVMTGDPVKTVNPGYISFDQTEQMAKSPAGYVVAGIKNCNGYVVAGVKNVKLD